MNLLIPNLKWDKEVWCILFFGLYLHLNLINDLTRPIFAGL